MAEETTNLQTGVLQQLEGILAILEDDWVYHRKFPARYHFNVSISIFCKFWVRRAKALSHGHAKCYSWDKR